MERNHAGGENARGNNGGVESGKGGGDRGGGGVVAIAEQRAVASATTRLCMVNCAVLKKGIGAGAVDKELNCSVMLTAPTKSQCALNAKLWWRAW